MWTRINELERIFNNMDIFQSKLGNAFSEFDQLSKAKHQWAHSEGFPRTNLHDTGEDLQLSVEVPGVNKDKLNVKIQGNYLEISGEKTATIPEGYNAHRTERETSSFSRSFTLPYEVDPEKTEASLKEGILNMRLPKSETAKPKKITIN